MRVVQQLLCRSVHFRGVGCEVLTPTGLVGQGGRERERLTAGRFNVVDPNIHTAEPAIGELTRLDPSDTVA
jgi:hypothetical protein